MKYQIYAVRRFDELCIKIGGPYRLSLLARLFRRLNALVREIYDISPEITPESLDTFFDSGGVMVIATHRQTIVGFACLVRVVKINGTAGRVEHVVVTEKHRGEGLSKKLMAPIIAIAREKNLRYLDLTIGQGPERDAANGLYKKLKFKIRDSNTYRLILG